MPTVSVHLSSETAPAQHFEVEANEVLYDGLERQGLYLPHGCLAGSCGSCRIHVMKGPENLSPMGAIETDTVAHLSSTYPDRTVRLSCRAKVLGDVEIVPLK